MLPQKTRERGISMSDELTEEFPNSVPDTEPTIMTLMERLRSMQESRDRRQELADRRHVELRELIFSARDDVINRVDVLQTATDSNFRKLGHRLEALNDSILSIRGDLREVFQRIATLEEKAS
jgi:hypothetical protein